MRIRSPDKQPDETEMLDLPFDKIGVPIPDLATLRTARVVETFIAIYFRRITGFADAHLEPLRNLVQKTTKAQERWNNVNDAPTIERVFDRFNEHGAWFAMPIALAIFGAPWQ
jgi:hypothetical protein